MDEPTRWSDPRGGAPEDLRRLLSAARSGPPVLPESVRSASATAVAGLAGGAKAAGWWTALKVVGALTAAGGAAVVVRDRPPRPPHHGAAPARARTRVPPTAQERPMPQSHDAPPPPANTQAAPPSTPAPVAARQVVAPEERPRDHESEAAMLERARALLASGDTALAVAVLREHARQHPRSVLAEERDYLTFRANARGATEAGVAREADRFLHRHPDGIYSAQVRALRGPRE
jgi:hypothetical protein